MIALGAVLVGLLLADPVEADRNGTRAALSYWAMKHYFFDRSSGLYRETRGTSSPAHAWPHSQALSATLAMALIPERGRLYLRDVKRDLVALNRYSRADGVYTAGPGPSGDVYYDDNEWIGLELLQWYRRSGNRILLARARKLFRLVTSAWDSDSTHACPGGVFWTQAEGNDDRNTVTTGTGALLAMRLYFATHDERYVSWARRMLAWIDACMLAPSGLLRDHLDVDGTIDETTWSYNQGTAIGASVLLYRATGDQAALQRARSLAKRSLDYYDSSRCVTEPPFFLAIFFRNMLELERVDGDHGYRGEAQAYADDVWDRLRDPATGLFRFHGPGREQLLEQAAVVQIYAALAGSSPVTVFP